MELSLEDFVHAERDFSSSSSGCCCRISNPLLCDSTKSSHCPSNSEWNGVKMARSFQRYGGAGVGSCHAKFP